MIKCPNADCGYENVDGTQYCEACGEELTQTNGASTMIPGDSKMIECPACGNQNPADNAVCEVCGAELHPGSAKPVSTPSATPSVVQAVGSTSPVGAASDPSANTGVGGVTAGSTQTPFDAALGGAGASPTAAPADTGVASPPATALMGDTGSGTGTALPTAASPDVTDSSLATDAAGALGTSPVVMAGDATSSVSAPSMPAVPAAPDTAMADTGATTVATDTATADTSVATADTGAAAMTAPVAGQELQPGKVKMTVEQGMSVGAQFVLGDSQMLVGREDSEEEIYPDIDLSDQDAGYVHRRHAELNFRDGKLFVTHLGGSNKTRVNNRPLPDNEPQEVHLGDKVAFGKVVLRVAPI